MTVPVEDLAAQALGLPPEAAWLRMAAQRREAARAGQVDMVPGDEALARVLARLA